MFIERRASYFLGELNMKTTLILGALALCLAAPSIASADAIVLTTNQHRHHHRADAVVINEDGARLHHRRHGTEAFYDNGNRHYWRRHHRPDTIIIKRSDDRPMHRRHRHVVIENSDY